MILGALLGKSIDPVSVLLRMMMRPKQDIPAELEGHIVLVDERNRFLLDDQGDYLVEE